MTAKEAIQFEKERLEEHKIKLSKLYKEVNVIRERIESSTEEEDKEQLQSKLNTKIRKIAYLIGYIKGIEYHYLELRKFCKL